MKVAFLLFLLFSFSAACAQEFQLAPPRISCSSIFFDDEMEVAIEFAQDDTQIYYTINGDTPTEQDLRYTKPVIVRDKITTIKARVYSAAYLPSDVSVSAFIKKGYEIRQMTVSQPNTKYSGSGSDTLFDNLGGIADHNSKTWLGYNRDTITCEIKLGEYQFADSVLLNVLENPGAWIFAPGEVEVFAIDRKTKKLKSIATKSFPPTDKEAVGCRVLVIPFEPIQTATLVVSIRSVSPIPGWHPGHGKQGWIFIDEINVY